MKISYKDISPKIKEVFFAEEAEAYLVVGDVTGKQALKAIHRYEKKECGLPKEELFSYDLEKVNVWEAFNKEAGENWYWWGSPPKDAKPIGIGWKGSI